MKILFLTDNFPPEVNAPATRTHEHCKEWVNLGAEVTVITCFPNFPQGKVYEGYKNRWKQIEMLDGIKVIRVWSYITANDGFFKRTIDYVSYAFTSFFVGLFVKTDVIIATSPQFFTAVSGRSLSLVKRKPWIMEVRDLWPESIKAVGALEEGFILNVLETIELKLYKSARLIVSLTHSFKKNMMERGINPDKINVIKNGSNLDLFSFKPKNENLINKLDLNGKFIVGYIGTLGMAHKLDFIVDCASEIEDNTIHFLFIGEGAEKKKLIEKSQKLKTNNITFLQPVLKEEVPDYVSIVDCMLVPLKKSDLFKTVIPSKIFEAAAMKKPILLGVDGESKEMVLNAGIGIYFEPENKDSFFKALMIFKNNNQIYNRCADKCIVFAEQHNRKILAQEMFKSINAILN